MVPLGGDVSNRDQTWQRYLWMSNTTTPHDSKCQGEDWGKVTLNTGKSMLGRNLFSPLGCVSSVPILGPVVLQPKTSLTWAAQWTKGCARFLPTSYKATLEVSWVAAVLFKEKERVMDFKLRPSAATLFASVRLSKVSLWKARNAGTRVLLPLGINLHSSSASGHTFHPC